MDSTLGKPGRKEDMGDHAGGTGHLAGICLKCRQQAILDQRLKKDSRGMFQCMINEQLVDVKIDSGLPGAAMSKALYLGLYRGNSGVRKGLKRKICLPEVRTGDLVLVTGHLCQLTVGFSWTNDSIELSTLIIPNLPSGGPLYLGTAAFARIQELVLEARPLTMKELSGGISLKRKDL